MKKTYLQEQLKSLFFVFVICLFSFFTFGCGLETFYYLDPPSQLHEAYYENNDDTLGYFSFLTNETNARGENYVYLSSDSEFKFLGTDIYYRIYKNSSSMINARNYVDNLLNSSDASVSASAEYLINTKKYKPLGLNINYSGSIIKADGTNKYVYIRLNNYGSEEEFKSVVCVGTKMISSYSSTDDSITKNYLPRRSINNSKYGFNFNADDDDNPVPLSTDDDVEAFSTDDGERKWYVDMYAVSVGRDNSYTYSYSQVVPLGSITIDESYYD